MLAMVKSQRSSDEVARSRRYKERADEVLLSRSNSKSSVSFSAGQSMDEIFGILQSFKKQG